MTLRLNPIAVATTVSFSLALLACGGGGPSRPKPLQHKFDEVHIVQVDVSKKDAVFKANEEHTRARSQHLKSKADLEEARSMLQLAKNELQQAKIEEDTANQKKKTAEASGDLNRIDPASKEQRITELQRRAADEKINARKAEIEYLKKFELYAEEEMYHQEARLEVAKAKVAVDNNIKPRDFSYEKYDQQVKERSKRSQEAKSRADKERGKVDSAKQKWKAALEQVAGARGSAN